MKREVTIIQDFCDFCNGESNAWNVCINCGKNICYDCRKVHAVEYRHAVWSSGSGDGLYCQECNRKLYVAGDKLHRSYLAIESLRNEMDGWNRSFSERAKEAETRLKSLQEGS